MCELTHSRPHRQSCTGSHLIMTVDIYEVLCQERMCARYNPEHYLFSQSRYDTGSVSVAPVVWLRTLGLREVKQLSQGHTANESGLGHKPRSACLQHTHSLHVSQMCTHPRHIDTRVWTLHTPSHLYMEVCEPRERALTHAGGHRPCGNPENSASGSASAHGRAGP